MKPEIDPRKIVVITGAGISAESGLSTYRDPGGLWQKYDFRALATSEAMETRTAEVLEFYNARRRQLATVFPNDAHRALARLDDHFDTVIVTQNVDDLHERGGSKNVIHVHGQLAQVRGSADPAWVKTVPYDREIRVGDLAPDGSQLRPNIVLFGENVRGFEEAHAHLRTAAKVLVVGTSLSVYPAAGLLKSARYKAEKTIVSLEIDHCPHGYQFLRGKACDLIPGIVNKWLKEKPVK